MKLLTFHLAFCMSRAPQRAAVRSAKVPGIGGGGVLPVSGDGVLPVSGDGVLPVSGDVTGHDDWKRDENGQFLLFLVKNLQGITLFLWISFSQICLFWSNLLCLLVNFRTGVSLSWGLF